MEIYEIKKVKDKWKDSLLKRKNVVGVGIGRKEVAGEETDELVIRIYVTKKEEGDNLHPNDFIPSALTYAGLKVKTDVRVVGVIKALLDRTARYRPFSGGVSIGHFRITAGTVGAVVFKDGQKLVLSNNHVLANSNDCSIGDEIRQPGPHDGGSQSDKVGTLYKYVPIQFPGGSNCSISRSVCNFLNAISKVFGRQSRFEAFAPTENEVDTGLALLDNPDDANLDIVEVGTVTGMEEADMSTPLIKSGRTTETTRGKVTDLDVTIKVSYGEHGTATFINQILSDIKSDGGDSGSLVLNEANKKAVGLLFAGGQGITVINNIKAVHDQLGGFSFTP
jgi:hypothetical protein